MIDLSKCSLPKQKQFPLKIYLEVDWPFSVEYNNLIYICNKKEGTRVKDGCPVAEYYTLENGDRRLWLGLDGKIEED